MTAATDGIGVVCIVEELARIEDRPYVCGKACSMRLNCLLRDRLTRVQE